jgi:hypothetical protein
MADEIKRYTKTKKINAVEVYRVTDVMFCNISGVLMVYVVRGDVQKMTFTSLNAIDILNIPNTPREFLTYKDKVLDYLSEKYRQKSEYEFFNRNFDFQVAVCNTNINILVKRRAI